MLREHRRGTLTQSDNLRKEFFKKKVTCDLSLRKIVVDQMKKVTKAFYAEEIECKSNRRKQ